VKYHLHFAEYTPKMGPTMQSITESTNNTLQLKLSHDVLTILKLVKRGSCHRGIHALEVTKYMSELTGSTIIIAACAGSCHYLEAIARWSARWSSRLSKDIGFVSQNHVQIDHGYLYIMNDMFAPMGILKFNNFL